MRPPYHAAVGKDFAFGCPSRGGRSDPRPNSIPAPEGPADFESLSQMNQNGLRNSYPKVRQFYMITRVTRPPHIPPKPLVKLQLHDVPHSQSGGIQTAS